jgi:hypothetical protein
MNNLNLDMNSIGSMIRSGHFRHGVEAIIHTAPSGVVSIYRAHRLAKLITDETLMLASCLCRDTTPFR